jgi:hypothetical protein
MADAPDPLARLMGVGNPAHPGRQLAQDLKVHRETSIIVNGTRRTGNEATIIRMALASFASILANKLGLKDDGIALTDQYQSATARVLALMDVRPLQVTPHLGVKL